MTSLWKELTLSIPLAKYCKNRDKKGRGVVSESGNLRDVCVDVCMWIEEEFVVWGKNRLTVNGCWFTPKLTDSWELASQRSKGMNHVNGPTYHSSLL